MLAIVDGVVEVLMTRIDWLMLLILGIGWLYMFTQTFILS
jgi:hypothetical protein